VAYYSRETVFKDVDSIPLGIDFRKAFDPIREGMCQVLLAVIGHTGSNPAAVKGAWTIRDFVRIESNRA
jgi:hypothetical protein